MKRLVLIGLCLLLFAWRIVNADTFVMPAPGDNIVGAVKTIYLEPQQSLYRIAQHYDLGYEELIRANPHINPNKPKAWSKIVIPSAYILPDTAYEGIVINIPEMRLYYYMPQQRLVMTFPIGVGRYGWSTPELATRVISKRKHPTWFVPDSIRDYMAQRGVELPDYIEPGPNNPLGQYALYLAAKGYLIHGTNRPTSVGKRSSSGCIRLYPKDIQQLFAAVTVGTPVRIINQPVKAGWLQGGLYVEVHRPFGDHPVASGNFSSPLRKAVMKASSQRAVILNWENIYKLTAGYKGYPIFINREL